MERYLLLFETAACRCVVAIYLERKTLEMKNILSRLWKEEEGQDLTEYALLVVLVALGSVAAMGSLSQAISKVFSSAAANITT